VFSQSKRILLLRISTESSKPDSLITDYKRAEFFIGEIDKETEQTPIQDHRITDDCIIHGRRHETPCLTNGHPIPFEREPVL
jgi:hypothetical protein